jgi:hypothetical protein
MLRPIVFNLLVLGADFISLLANSVYKGDKCYINLKVLLIPKAIYLNEVVYLLSYSSYNSESAYNYTS